jgi:hypothetical protein
MPKHEWDGTRLRFEKPDGSWGQWVDLRGVRGVNGETIIQQGGGGGGGSLSIQKFYPTVADFPAVGKTQILYFDQSTDPYGVYVWTGAEYQQVGGGGATSEEYFETVSRNLVSADAVLNYNGGGDLTSIVYENGITKSLTYNDGGDLITITLSGSTPSGIDLVKSLGYSDSGDLVSVSYS